MRMSRPGREEGNPARIGHAAVGRCAVARRAVAGRTVMASTRTWSRGEAYRLEIIAGQFPISRMRWMSGSERAGYCCCGQYRKYNWDVVMLLDQSQTLQPLLLPSRNDTENIGCYRCC